MANATGSLSIFEIFSTSPASFIRTITDRRRCRSIPTYCCSRSTRVSFRFRVGLVTPSLLCTLGSRRREEPWRITTESVITNLLHLGAPDPHHQARSRESGAALLHGINSAPPIWLEDTQRSNVLTRRSNATLPCMAPAGMFSKVNEAMNKVMVPLMASPRWRSTFDRFVAVVTYTGRRSGGHFSTPVFYR